MKPFIIFPFLTLLLLAAFTHQASKTTTQPSQNKGFVLLELFTSQGCSSCPAADKLLEKTIVEAQKTGKKIYALSYHVDYWDRLGWKDPYSQAQFTQRQYNYSEWFGNPNVYTPQVVANGQEEFVGSNAGKMVQVVDKMLKDEPKINITFETVEWKNDRLNLAINLSNLPKNSQLNIALVSKNTENYIPRSENEGRKLTGANVVRVFQKIPALALQNKVSLSLPKDAEKVNTQLIAFVQDNTTHRVTGVGALMF